MSTQNEPSSRMITRRIKKSAETQMVQKQSSVSRKIIKSTAVADSSIPAISLLNLTVTNNTLPVCIEAMEVNIDGTGHDIVASVEGENMDEGEMKRASSFFKEPFPGTSMVSLRREMRRYLEGAGNAYIELIPNKKGELIMMRVLKTQYMRLGPMSDPTEVTRLVERNGELISVNLMDRERAYIYQEPDSDPVYFIEFGATQIIDSRTGQFYAPNSAEVGTITRGNELIHLKMNDDPNSDYGIPRWLSQTPSVVGSRKAEEQNLEFFDAGGIPNVLVFVQGGLLADSTTQQLNGYLSGGLKAGGRAGVVEIANGSGSLDKPGSVSVQVERFGSETLGDKMYEDYDQRCEERVRLAFRLPGLFIGKTSDYNYATAKVAYQVAEAQVFKPDRDEFDALMNQLIIKKMGLKTVAFKSRPITLNDIENQLKGLEMVKEVVEPEEFVGEVAGLTNISVTYKQGKEFTSFKNLNGRVASNQEMPLQQAAEPQKAATPEPAKTKQKEEAGAVVKKSIGGLEILNMAKKFASVSGLGSDDTAVDLEEQQNLKKLFHTLIEEDQEALRQTVSLITFGVDTLLPAELFNL